MAASLSSTAAGSPDPAAAASPAERLAMVDLREQIEQAERRLVAREQRLRRGVSTVAARVRQNLQPRRLVWPLAGLAAAGAAVWWLLSSRAPRAPSVARAPSSGLAALVQRSMKGAGGWVRLIGLAWPLLPAQWRARVSPVTASAVMSIGLPLIERAFGGRSLPDPVAAPQVDLWRYAGTWYEVARLPAPFEGLCAGQPQAHYTLRADGSFDVENRCRDAGGQWRSAFGSARVVPGSAGAKLRVSLWPTAWRWLPIAWADYWILHVDDDYSEALVGDPHRHFLWLLSRRPTLPEARLQHLRQLALQQGYAVERLHFPIDTP
jgi:apolipoprotein D and lipocalin family protein